MTKLNQIYKCSVCGNIVEVVQTGAGELVCCGQPMNLQAEKTEDTGSEKHVPIIKKEKVSTIIEVGSIPHPMEDAHYIEWIEAITEDGKRIRKFLKAGDAPQAEFKCQSKIVNARAYCNVHGLWMSAQ